MSLLHYVIYSALNWAHYSLSGLVQQILTTISSNYSTRRLPAYNKVTRLLVACGREGEEECPDGLFCTGGMCLLGCQSNNCSEDFTCKQGACHPECTVI